MSLPPSANARVAARLGTWIRDTYRVEGLIGTGGSAAVYAARRRNGERVAIKFLRDDLLLGEDAMNRFSQEQLLANEIKHPGVVPVLDSGAAEDGQVYLVMPLLPGETLRSCWDRLGKRLPLEQAVVIMLDVLDILAAVHAKNVIHRDIKPENIFITTNGEIRLLDFGIARCLDKDLSLTLTGQALGTVAFMPPEQALGNPRDIGPHSDCWAVGATLFRLLSGEVVHAGGPHGERLLAAARQRARSLGEAASHVPGPIVACVDKALEFDVANRWASAKEMRDALREAFERAVGERLTSVASRVRAELRRDLAAASHPRHLVDSLSGSVSEADLATRPLAALTRRLISFPGVIVLIATLVFAVTAWNSRPRHQAAYVSRKPEAHAAFEAGRHLWHDASMEAARRKFEEVTTIDTGFAAAHLYFAAASDWIEPEVRIHFAKARELSEWLTQEQKELLDAIEPLMAEPPIYQDTAARLDALVAKRPNDETVWAVLVAHALRQGQVVKVFPSLPHLHGGLALWFRARAHLLQDNVVAARQSLEACATSSSPGFDCLVWLAQLEANEGRCDASTVAARRLIALDHESPEGYNWLARAEFGTSHRTERVRGVLRDKWAHVPESRREFERQRDEFFLAIQDGQFTSAYDALQAWENEASKFADTMLRLYPFIARFELDLELGRTTEAAATVRVLANSSSTWLRNDSMDAQVETTRALYLTGLVNRDEFLQLRARDDEVLAKLGGFFSPGVRWYDAYVQAIKSPEDARMAIEQQPPERPALDAILRDVGVEAGIGDMYLLAGDISAALTPLHRAVKSCTYWRALEGVRAHAHYGEALERSDVPAACSEYNYVLSRWGGDGRSVTALRARENASRLGCSGLGR